MSRPLCVLVGVCGILAAGASPALGAFPGENGRIAFVREPAGGDADIWSMNPSGSHQVNLTPDSAANEGDPNWSADGRKIAFASDRASRTQPRLRARLRGLRDGRRRVQRQAGHRQRVRRRDPAWAPDGRRIVFARDYDPIRGGVDLDVLTVKRLDGEATSGTSPTAASVQEYAANWSPERALRSRSSSELGRRPRDLDDEPHGSNQRQPRSTKAVHDEFPNWSPDSRRIAFNRHLRDASSRSPPCAPTAATRPG